MYSNTLVNDLLKVARFSGIILFTIMTIVEIPRRDGGRMLAPSKAHRL